MENGKVSKGIVMNVFVHYISQKAKQVERAKGIAVPATECV